MFNRLCSECHENFQLHSICFDDDSENVVVTVSCFCGFANVNYHVKEFSRWKKQESRQ